MPLLSDSLRNLSSSLLISAILIAGLVLGADVLIPITLATILAFILSPIVRWMTQLRLPRGIAVSFVMIFLLGAFALFTGVISNQLLSLTAGLDSYRTNVVEKVRTVTGGVAGRSGISKAAGAVDSLGAAIQKEMAPPAAAKTAGSPSPAGAERTVVVTRETDAADSGLLKYFKTAGAPLAKLALTVLFTLFLLLQHRDLRDRVVRVVGTDHMTDTTSAMSDAGERLSKLFLMQAFLNISFGAVTGIALWFIGVPNALLWACLTAVMRFIPYIGSLLSAVPPILLAAAVDPGWGMFFATLALFVIGEPLMGHIIEPLVLGKRAGVSPFAMVVSASFWTLVWGPIGLVLAAPLTMCLVVLGRYIPGLEFFSVLLGDEPALSPQQELYHRILSEDAVSAADQLETAISDSSYAHAADSLIFPALQLASQDMRLGRLEKQQVIEFGATAGTLATVVADDRQVQAGATSENTNQRRILIVPVRGSIDAVAGKFVSQILKTSASQFDVSVSSASGLTALSGEKSQSGAVPPDFIVLVNIGGLEVRQLRYVLKRAAREFPGAGIVLFDVRPEIEASLSGGDDAGGNVIIHRSAASLAAFMNCDGQRTVEELRPVPKTALALAG